MATGNDDPEACGVSELRGVLSAILANGAQEKYLRRLFSLPYSEWPEP